MKRDVLWFLKWTFGLSLMGLFAGVDLADSSLGWRFFMWVAVDFLDRAFNVLLVLCGGGIIGAVAAECLGIWHDLRNQRMIT